ncbi:hypothetical protein C1637_07635 [Chryseobacterium lactis]|uniref:Lipoprotein n=1 Tax=Chryseobacterium lactis TaxID=1241981 RepID=A0A3G6RLD8_CHRLC|nr:hypothetical protein [Chryseobacterium lactis]AZA84699.1 hypothetical protein EG342_23605 [Chryseobacterium lactis]AZB05088.1 hypothetical protein EG341_14485 [Chryseobacterium lactis]PNW14819.1 hypothetical protein C1637_07635 [Chryseobacterium lactis]
MKINTLMIPLMACILFSCKDKKETVKNEVSIPSAVDTVKAVPPGEIDTADTGKTEELTAGKTDQKSDTDTVEEPETVNYNFHFDRFPSVPYQFVKKAKLDFSSNEGSYNFRTRIKEAYAAGTPDFASYYITVTFGCGSSCIMGLMMDVRDGKIYGLPLGEETSCLFAEDRAIFDAKSRLFIASICKESPESETVFYHAFVWNEQKKAFEKAEEKDIK